MTLFIKAEEFPKATGGSFLSIDLGIRFGFSDTNFFLICLNMSAFTYLSHHHDLLQECSITVI